MLATIHSAHPAPPTPMERHRFHVLDGLRGIAALVVACGHSPALGFLHINNYFLAVDLFFCLSGFVIAFSYEDRLRGGLSLSTFLKARFIRLYPAYFCAALFGIATAVELAYVSMAPHAKDFLGLLSVLSVLGLPNVFPSVSPFSFPQNLPVWSLFFEVVANVIFAFAVRSLSIGTRGFCCAWVGTTALLGYFSTYHPLGWGGYGGVNTPTLIFAMGLARVLLTFLAGVLLHRLYRALQQRIASQPLLLRWSLAPIAVALMLLFLFGPGMLSATEAAHFAICAVALPAVVLAGAVARVSGALARICAALGEMSYPFYVFHRLILGLFDRRHILEFLQQRSITTTALPVIGILVGMGVSYAFALYAERPARRYLTQRLRFAPSAGHA